MSYDLKLYYEDGTEVNGVITNYKPPLPSFKVIKNKPLKGNTRFQKINGQNDARIKFSVVFDISECGSSAYIKFMNHYHDLFKFVDEWGRYYTGHLETGIDIDMPIEGEIYYIGVEMHCNCEVSGI